MATGSNFNSAPDVATNLLVPLQAKVIVESCCCASADCVKASKRTAQINLIDDRPSLLCQMPSLSADIIAAETASAKSVSGHLGTSGTRPSRLRDPERTNNGNSSAAAIRFGDKADIAFVAFIISLG
ncbi:hypothetical protein [Bradyrhizobium sp. S3.3.6]|uniref:hypothetical protein n=1 Tax=Bradyrhizobium sp. S3.3.6 TaxID=3156429 RepID=UPI00339609AD